MTTIRAVLLACDDGPIGDPISRDVQEHCKLAAEAGLLRRRSGRWEVTQEGHDFLTLCRDEGVWERTVRRIRTGAGSAPFEVWCDVLRDEKARQP